MIYEGQGGIHRTSTLQNGFSCNQKVPKASLYPSQIPINFDRMPPEYERPYLQLVRSPQVIQALPYLLPLSFPPLVLHLKIPHHLRCHHHRLRMPLQRCLSQLSVSILPLFLPPHHLAISLHLLSPIDRHFPLLLLSLYFLHLKYLK